MADVWNREAALSVFDEYLRRSRGLSDGTRRNYVRFAGAFLQTAFPEGEVDIG